MVVGLAALYEASSLAFGTLRQPGSGFYPTLVSIALILLGGLALGDKRPPRREPGASGAHTRVWLVVFALAVYAWALVPVGFILCTVALLVLLLRLGQVSWVASATVAGVGAIGCYGAFMQLGLALPAGVLAF